MRVESNLSHFYLSRIDDNVQSIIIITKKTLSHHSTHSAVHCGAGYHSNANSKTFENIMKQALYHTRNQYFTNQYETNSIQHCLSACSYCISILENSPFTNAGFGSNLNREGRVECDACLCYSDTHHSKLYASCGAIFGVYNPILMCHQMILDIISNSSGIYSSCQLIKPLFLCGRGTLEYIKLNNINGLLYCNLENELHDYMITEKSRIEFNKYRNILNNTSSGIRSDNTNNNIVNPNNTSSSTLYDTVGAIVYYNGVLCSCVSSGGILLKYPGRIGEAAIYGSGCSSESVVVESLSDQSDEEMDELRNRSDKNPSHSLIQLANNFSGIGEDIMFNQMSNHLNYQILELDKTMEQSFNSLFSLNSLFGMKERKIGCMSCKVYDGCELEFGYAFSTESMGIGYTHSNDSSYCVEIKRLNHCLDSSSSSSSSSSIQVIPIKF